MKKTDVSIEDPLLRVQLAYAINCTTNAVNVVSTESMEGEFLV